MSSDSLTNLNTIYITSKTLSYDGIYEYLEALVADVLAKISEEFPKMKKLDGRFEINSPRNSNHCYVWFKSAEVVNVIIGLNPNGSKRTTSVDNDDGVTDNWASATTTEVELPPLVNILKYNGEDDILIDRSQILLKEGYKTDAIFCPKVSTKVTAVDIVKVFGCYSVTNDAPKPIVTFKDSKAGRICTVKFSQGSTDGAFAQQMKMFVSVKGESLMWKLSK